MQIILKRGCSGNSGGIFNVDRCFFLGGGGSSKAEAASAYIWTSIMYLNAIPSNNNRITSKET